MRRDVVAIFWGWHAFCDVCFLLANFKLKSATRRDLNLELFHGR